MKPCNQCGKCCIHYSDGGLSATPEEVASWKTHHPEIYQYVQQGEIWFNPITKQRFKRCPFLEETAIKKFTCRIYLYRPDDCRHYPVTIAEMVRDECEMIEAVDLKRPKMAQRKLDKIMAESRPSVS